jgi:hypothetical protein
MYFYSSFSISAQAFTSVNVHILKTEIFIKNENRKFTSGRGDPPYFTGFTACGYYLLSSLIVYSYIRKVVTFHLRENDQQILPCRVSE